MASNDELQQELAALRAEMRVLRAQLTAREEPLEAPSRLLSRRNLLRAAPVAAIGAGIAAISASPAAAADGDAIIIGETNTGTSSTILEASLSGGNVALIVDGGIATDILSAGNIGSNPGGTVISGFPNAGVALTVIGNSHFADGIDDGSDAMHVSGLGGGVGLTVDWNDAGGDVGGHSPGAALVLTTVTCDPLDITTQGGQVNVKVTGSATTIDAMTIDYAGEGRGFYAESTAVTNVNGTITGVNDGTGIGVWGEHRNAKAPGIGVVGVGGDQGRGAQLTGGAAQLRMVPAAAASHPGFTGKAGDFVVDASARLWFCKKANTSSVPAVWHQLA
jgi:hypothetical protein